MDIADVQPDVLPHVQECHTTAQTGADRLRSHRCASYRGLMPQNNEPASPGHVTGEARRGPIRGPVADVSTPPTRRGADWPRMSLRLVSGIQTILVFTQAVLAGHLLTGQTGARAFHDVLGTEVVTWLAFLQIVFALLLWRPGRGTVWPIPVATVIVAAVVFQIGAGFQGRPALHIPLGVAILGANLALAILLRRPPGRRPTVRKRPTTVRGSLAVIAALALGLAACAPDAGQRPAAGDPTTDTVTVALRDTQFQPDDVTIDAGSTVTWVWDDGSIRHDVVGDGFASETKADSTFSHTFTEPGTYPYECTLHPQMTGTVTVVAS